MIIYENILKEFQKQKIKYVLVGGIALNLLGGFRNTLDMDILVEMSDKNLHKIVVALKKFGYSVKQPVDPMGIADKKTREEWINNKHMKAFNFYKDERSYEEVDIIISSSVTYETASKNKVKVKVGKLTLPVISVKDFIKMKKASGREIDLLDIKEIKIARKKK
ncbi:nucleotidyltransferase domain-containing protein [Candidatus Omnitrophota bacterium]